MKTLIILLFACILSIGCNSYHQRNTVYSYEQEERRLMKQVTLSRYILNSQLRDHATIIRRNRDSDSTLLRLVSKDIDSNKHNIKKLVANLDSVRINLYLLDKMR